MKSPWEKIADGPVNSYRMKVPGGWILMTWTMSGVHHVFIADPQHTWTFED